MPPRYNLGFGLFGPLEQSSTGKFCQAKDVEKITTEQEQIIHQQQQLIEKLQGEIKRKNEVLDEALEVINYSAKALDNKQKQNRKLINLVQHKEIRGDVMLGMLTAVWIGTIVRLFIFSFLGL